MSVFEQFKIKYNPKTHIHVNTNKILMKEILFIIGSVISYVVTKNVKEKKRITSHDLATENELIKNQLIDQLLTDNIRN